MKLWLIVPVKPLPEGKSRLAGILSPAARAALMRHLLQHVLISAQATTLFTEIMVVSRDPEVWALAHLAGAAALREQGRDLNPALEQARHWALERGADAILVLPADLPLITAQDIQGLVALAGSQPGVVISPSQGGGTSALLLHPPDTIPFAFGPDSFQQHCRLADSFHSPLKIYRSETLAFDVDLPEDWRTVKDGLGSAIGQVNSEW